MDIHELFQSDSFPYISGRILYDLKEQLGFEKDTNESSSALLVVDVQGYHLTEFAFKALHSNKPGILEVTNLKEIEELLATPQKDKGFSVALINTTLGSFNLAMLEALRWDPEVIIIDQGSLDNFPSEDQQLITRAAMTGHAVYLVKIK